MPTDRATAALSRICSCFVQNVHLINRFAFCIALLRLSANARSLTKATSSRWRKDGSSTSSVALPPSSVLFSRLHSSSASKHFSFPLKGTSPKPPLSSPPSFFPENLLECTSKPHVACRNLLRDVCKRSLGSAAPDPTHLVSHF